MSDEEEDEYEYEYDEDEEENNNKFEYTDDEEEQNDAEVALENAYYNAKGLRETSIPAAAAALEEVITQEQAQISSQQQSIHGSTCNKQYGPWSYKALKQLVKLYLRANAGASNFNIDQNTVLKHYRRLLDCISSPGSDISPAAVEKGIYGMLERVASLYNSISSPPPPPPSHQFNAMDTTGAGSTEESSLATGSLLGTPQSLALAVYDATLQIFHPYNGPCKNERLWFKTQLKYGQLLYELNETTKLQWALKELLQIHGEPESTDAADAGDSGGGGSNNSGGMNRTTSMEIYALQIQLYSRQNDTKKLRETFHKAMNVRGGVPHPRTIALIQGECFIKMPCAPCCKCYCCCLLLFTRFTHPPSMHPSTAAHRIGWQDVHVARRVRSRGQDILSSVQVLRRGGRSLAAPLPQVFGIGEHAAREQHQSV